MNRREFIGAAVAGAVGAALDSTGLADGARPIRGTVSTEGGKRMPGVIVSDGFNCVRTDVRGVFKLPARAGARFVTVTPPSGWWPTTSYHPVATAGYDFVLCRHPTSSGKGCRFVHISDSEIWGANPTEKEWIARVGRIAAETEAAFIVHTGDIIALGAHWQLMNHQTMSCPVIYCIGNHDMMEGEAGETKFESIYGPVWHSFEAGGIHFCVTPMNEGDHTPSYTMDDVADWLRNDLALIPTKMPVVVFNHMLANFEGSFPVSDHGFVVGNKRPIDLRKVCNFTGFVYGHAHRNKFVRFGKTSFVCTANPNMGGIDLSPESVRVVSVASDGRLTSDLRYGHVGTGVWRTTSAGAVWEAQAESPVLHVAPLVIGNTVCVGTSDENGHGTGGVTGLDARTGKCLWRHKMTGSVKGRMVCVGGRVVVQDSNGSIAALDPDNGRLFWENIVKPHPWHQLSSGLAADAEHGVVFSGVQDMLTATDVRTGQVLWRDGKWPGRSMVEPCSDAPGYGEGVVVMAGNWSGFFANDARTGKFLWWREGDPFVHAGAYPVIHGGKVRCLGCKSFYELDLKTGKTLRERKLGVNMQITTAVVETDKLLIFGSANEGLVALDKRTLEFAWHGEVGKSLTTFAAYSRPPEHCVGTVPIVVGNRVYAATTDGAIHAWNLTDGKREKSFATGAPYLAGVAVSGSALFAADLTGVVRRFEI